MPTDISQFEFEKLVRQRLELDSEFPLKKFDCGNADLNEFLVEDSKDFYKQLLAVTSLYLYEDDIVAFCSLLNDKIDIHDFEKLSKTKQKKLLPNGKRYLKYIPAVKIGRLGVDVRYGRKCVGSKILSLLKISFTVKNKTGCTFMTVDAYNEDATLNFYKRNGFDFFTDEDKDAETRAMYFDLRKFNALRKQMEN